MPRKKEPKAPFPVVKPNAFDGFIVEPGPGNGEKLIVLRNRATKLTRITIHSTESPYPCTLSDVALKALAKHLNALTRVS